MATADDLNELRALRRRTRAAVSKAQAAVGELIALESALDAAINRLLGSNQGNTDRASRVKGGEVRNRYCKAISDAGGTLDGVWVRFDEISAALADVSDADLLRSLSVGVENVIEQKGDEYRLLENGMKLVASL